MRTPPLINQAVPRMSQIERLRYFSATEFSVGICSIPACPDDVCSMAVKTVGIKYYY
jgi:hypothetical protein